ncbi:MAG: Ig-like domain-containing protein [Candidatus Peribacteria bacterium]|jgi:hypothetical protein|nr:Ig-like domain-containing protein [Candidatus Peribacteria bacterium]
MLFLDENADGVFNTGETKLANKTVNLYKGNTLQATVQTDINGHYLFSGLSNGIYRADFNDALGTYAHFTLKGTGDSSLTSQVEYVGANAGYSLNIDPVQSRAATINAGILNYIPSTDLTPTLYITGAILTLTTTGVTPTTGLQSTIAPSFFPHIQATSNAITRSSSDPTVASVSTTGRVEGKQAGTTTLTLTIKDLWGTTQTATTILTVENKIPLRCTIDYNPNSNTNGNVVATLTNCNKVITVTNNAGSINYVFTGNGNFDLHYQDSYGNTGTTTATVSRIDASEIQATITYVPDTPTSGNVQSIISFNKTGVTITSTA